MNKDRVNARTWWIISLFVLLVFVGMFLFLNFRVDPGLLEYHMAEHIDKYNGDKGDKGDILNELNDTIVTDSDFENNYELNYEQLEIIEEKYSLIINVKYKDSGKTVYNSFDHYHQETDSADENGSDLSAEIVFEADGEKSWIGRFSQWLADKHDAFEIKKGVINVLNTGENTETVKLNEYIRCEYGNEETKLLNSFWSDKDLEIYFDTHSYTTIMEETSQGRFWANAGIMFVVWLFFAIVIAGYQTNIQRLNLSVKEVSRSSEFEGNCPVGSTDVGRLGRNINTLLDKIRDKDKRISENNKVLQEKVDSSIRKEDEKKDFLANTAHELKTPISIIRGYAEGLKLGIAKGGRARQKYCDVIIDETEKMNTLVLELLDLSKYKQKLYEDIKLENISIRSFVQANLNSMEPILKEKNISVENTINKKFIGRTDIEKQNLVLRNYIKNAISHTDMYRKIVISCVEKPNCYRVYVYNTGEKISEENMKNIWDSFYRDDKSHGRSEGRFGLGLSIVASIQESLKMGYGVKNIYGGVQFWFDIKKPE